MAAKRAADKTPRALAREKTTADIIEEGRRQLAEHGAAGLSLRSVARELGMVSSAVYRYVASRDDLLTRLIVEAYDALGETVEHSVEATRDQAPLGRWVQAAHQIREWALTQPHEYFLLYGTPVPGYAAPEMTGVSGTRATRALASIVTDANSRLDRNNQAMVVVSDQLATDFIGLRANVDNGDHLGDDELLAFLTSWTQLFGLLSFELSNQTRGMVEHHRDLFDSAVRLMATHMGLATSD